MSDLVKRLREVWEWHRENECDHTLLRKSADLIEQQQQEIERLKGHLAGHERLASRGIYYTMDEIRQHDSELATRAVYDLKYEVHRAIGNLEYAAFNLCESMDLDSESGGRKVETTCPEKSLLIAIRDLKEATGAR